jgi:zinc D-Ala-D-Ala dipeptidase
VSFNLALQIKGLSTFTAFFSRRFMPPIVCVSVTVCLLSLSVAAQDGPSLLEKLALSRQMVVVTTRDWTVTDGMLRRFERREHGWEQIGPALPVVVGRNGMAWGRGLANPPASSDPQKREGDGRSPAGIFHLPYAFGYAAPDRVREIKLPYIQCTENVECIDDTNSNFYNIIKDRREVDKVDWKSSEKMKLSDNEYKLGIFVAHNTTPTVPGAGSCVFMHIWKENGHPTSGCTAMSEGVIESLLGWLDPRASPVLTQLPEKVYQARQTDWKLPAIDF